MSHPSTVVFTALLVIYLTGYLAHAKKKPSAPDEGYCSAYQFGGTSHVHYYSCCNNCNQGSPPTCDGVTYQGASEGQYCGPCGDPIGGGVHVRRYFLVGPRQRKTGGCDAQAACVQKCEPVDLFPGTCWVWTLCFSDCVKKSAELAAAGLDAAAVADESFCGDGICGAGKNITTCPVDCCALMDPQCARTNSTCPPKRCAYPDCQMPTSTSKLTNGEIAGIIISVLIVVSVGIGISMLVWRKNRRDASEAEQQHINA